jgi:hypothetical protein
MTSLLFIHNHEIRFLLGNSKVKKLSWEYKHQERDLMNPQMKRES